MVHLKKFIDKVTYADSKKSRDIILTMDEARGLKDEIAKLLTDLYNLQKQENTKEEVIKVEITGGKFK